MEHNQRTMHIIFYVASPISIPEAYLIFYWKEKYNRTTFKPELETLEGVLKNDCFFFLIGWATKKQITANLFLIKMYVLKWQKNLAVHTFGTHKMSGHVFVLCFPAKCTKKMELFIAHAIHMVYGCIIILLSSHLYVVLQQKNRSRSVLSDWSTPAMGAPLGPMSLNLYISSLY